jgi:LuxR family transcriptional regulator, maltose regulon positive regulatory protein
VEPAFRFGTADTSDAPVNRGVVFRRTLIERIEAAGRVIVVSAPAGSGKTFLLRSWIGEAGLVDRAAWVSVQREERDPQRFWISVADAVRDTAAASSLVRPLTAAPDLDGWAIMERLLEDLAPLRGQFWLVIDDLNELRSEESLHQLELLMMRAPASLRFVLATRHDLHLGLHRLRLEGQLTEIRATDLSFTRAEARALFEAAGVPLSNAALARLHDRTEGWAAGLRLAALSLAGHPDADRFAAEFSGSERTVAEYLLAEVLERQTEPVRQLLLRTSVLERVSGELADLLTGGSGGERVLQELELVNAFVSSLDAQRSWFRYHPMFADLLQLELRRSAPDELPRLHHAAAVWYAEHGYPVEAVRHAQATQDWDLAGRRLSDQWFGLVLDGRGATVRNLLTGFPADVVGAEAELAALMAGDELVHGTLAEAERYLILAAGALASLPAARRERIEVVLAVLRMWLARQRGDLLAVSKEAHQLLAPADVAGEAPAETSADAAANAAGAGPLGLGEDLRALALINLGIAELWAADFKQAERHLGQGVALAHRIGRPYLELTGLAHGSELAALRSYTRGAQRSMQAIDLAGQNGWSDEPIVAVAYTVLGGVMVAQGRLAEGERWLGHAARTLRPEVEPAAGMHLHYARGGLEMARGRHAEAITAFRAARRLAETLVTPHTLVTPMRAAMLQALVLQGETRRAERALAEMDSSERAGGEMRNAIALLRLAKHDPQGASAVLAPVLDGSVRAHPVWVVEAALLEAILRDTFGDAAASGRALERALDVAEPDRVLIPFLIHPAPRLLERHRSRTTTHAVLVSEILGALGTPSAPGSAGSAAPPGEARSLREPLSQAEARVLRYLPSDLTMPEIAEQLYLSVNTVRTHTRHIYDKLGAHRRHEVVDRARALGLLAPVVHKVPAPRQADMRHLLHCPVFWIHCLLFQFRYPLRWNAPLSGRPRPGTRLQGHPGDRDDDHDHDCRHNRRIAVCVAEHKVAE